MEPSSPSESGIADTLCSKIQALEDRIEACNSDNLLKLDVSGKVGDRISSYSQNTSVKANFLEAFVEPLEMFEVHNRLTEELRGLEEQVNVLSSTILLADVHGIQNSQLMSNDVSLWNCYLPLSSS